MVERLYDTVTYKAEIRDDLRTSTEGHNDMVYVKKFLRNAYVNYNVNQ